MDSPLFKNERICAEILNPFSLFYDSSEKTEKGINFSYYMGQSTYNRKKNIFYRFLPFI